MPPINLWAVLAAAVSSFAPGGLWYSPALFGKAWMRETGLTKEALGEHSIGLVFGLSFVLSVVAAAVFALFRGPEVDLGFGFGAGLSAGLCWVAASFAINDLFEGKSFRLLAINGGDHTVHFTLFGVILGAW